MKTCTQNFNLRAVSQKFLKKEKKEKAHQLSSKNVK